MADIDSLLEATQFHASVDANSVRFQSKGLNYGFIEYDDPGAAERAMQTLNGRRVHQSVIACINDPFAETSC